ncbi:MAG: DUF167 domain-containing protein [Pyrinomonadaceae bacterium]
MKGKVTEKENSIVFSVRVVPRAAKSEIIGEHDGALKVRIASPPVDGAANAELIKLLTNHFSVSRSDVEILSGLTSKTKRIRITGISEIGFPML